MGFDLSVSPSLLAADYGFLADAATAAEHGGAGSLHLDYMDGHYVPNISFGIDLIRALKKRISIPLIAHLMISNAEERVEDFIEAGPDYIVLQEDAVTDAPALIERIRAAGIRPGIAISPPRSLDHILPLLDTVDYLLVLSVNPGFGGQSFIESTLEKMRAASRLRESRGLQFDIAVDGGVNLKTAPAIIETGANVLIAGTGIYGKENVKDAIADFLKLGNA